jgi:ribosome modulation factor
MNAAQYFNEGKQSFLDGKTDASCPYPSNNNQKSLSKRRRAWMNGFYSTSVEKNLSHVFQKYGVKWED